MDCGLCYRVRQLESSADGTEQKMIQLELNGEFVDRLQIGLKPKDPSDFIEGNDYVQRPESIFSDKCMSIFCSHFKLSLSPRCLATIVDVQNGTRTTLAGLKLITSNVGLSS